MFQVSDVEEIIPIYLYNSVQGLLQFVIAISQKFIFWNKIFLFKATNGILELIMSGF